MRTAARLRPNRWGVRTPVALVVALLAAAVAAPSALAHATLVETSPHDGQTLSRAPTQVRLRFDEPVRVLGGMKVVRNDGGSVLARKPHASGRDVVLPLSRIGDGDYTALYRVLSDDGHVETGVLVFRVGAGTGPLEPALTAGGTVAARDLVSRFLVFAGLLLAAGTALFRLLVWRVVVPGRERPPHELALLLGGFVAIFLGASGLTGHGLPFTRFGISYGALIALAVCGAVAAAISAADPPVRWLALVLALVIVPLPSIAGHALEDGRLRTPEVVLDAAHLLAASAWLGGIASLFASLHGLETALRRRVVARFSTLALAAVLLLAATGVGRALGELRSVSQLWTTSYGVAILVKSGLFVALVLAGAAQRRWLIPAGAGAAMRRGLRLELALLLGAVAAVAFLTDARPGRSIRPAARVAGGPITLPPPDAVVFAAQSRDLALGFALRGSGSSTELTLTAIDQLGRGADGLDPSLELPGRPAVPLQPCGPGCYRGVVPHRGGRATLRLSARPPVPLVLPSPAAPSADALVAAVTRRYDALRSVVIDEELGSGTSSIYRTRYELVAPDGLAYQVANGGPQAVILGARRWDRTSATGRWVASAQDRLPQPRVWWGPGRPRDVHLVGSARIGGRPVDVVTLLSPRLKAWFTVWIDPHRKLPLALRMVAAAHFMHHRYSGFDRPLRLRPPG